MTESRADANPHTAEVSDGNAMGRDAVVGADAAWGTNWLSALIVKK